MHLLRPFDMLPHCATASNSRRHLAPASASARISGMEAVLGVALLERGRRGVIPTAAGRADAVARLVEAGIGVGVLPLTAIERYGSADLVPMPLTDDGRIAA